MRRAPGLFVFGLAAAWAVTGWAVGPADAGVRDGGLGDAGALDAGLAADAGLVDAGLVDAGRRASWRAYTTALFDGGVSDLVDLAVGASVEVTFPQPTIETICDDVTLFRLEPTPHSWRFVGVKPGRTHCGFWFSPQPFPHRYVELTITP